MTSFSSDLKREITVSGLKAPCCRRAFLIGVFSAKGRSCDSEAICRTENRDYLDFISKYLTEQYGKEPEIKKSTSGGRGLIFHVKSPALNRIIARVDEGYVEFQEKCPFCKSSFFKGLFFSSGRVSDPDKQFSLEFSFGDRCAIFKDFFSEQGINLKISKKQNETVLYTRNSSQIEDFFALAELQSATFAVMNLKIKNTFKNDANRRRNFDTVNISKAVDTAREQSKLIEALAKKGLLNSLPPELEATARLRLENPDMSMTQLALHSVPIISKSGLIHRMDRLLKLAEKMLSKY